MQQPTNKQNVPQMSTQVPKTSETSKSETTTLKNYYEILELNQNATLPEIERSYQKLILKWHPDKHTADRKLAEKKFN